MKSSILLFLKTKTMFTVKIIYITRNGRLFTQAFS